MAALVQPSVLALKVALETLEVLWTERAQTRLFSSFNSD